MHIGSVSNRCFLLLFFGFVSVFTVFVAYAGQRLLVLFKVEASLSTKRTTHAATLALTLVSLKYIVNGFLNVDDFDTFV